MSHAIGVCRGQVPEGRLVDHEGPAFNSCQLQTHHLQGLGQGCPQQILPIVMQRGFWGLGLVTIWTEVSLSAWIACAYGSKSIAPKAVIQGIMGLGVPKS